MSFTIAIIGLGLMGGSMGYALKGFRGCKRIGFDTNADVLARAARRGAVDEACGDIESSVRQADLSIFCTYPADIERAIELYAGCFKPGSVVTEICGVKHTICEIARRVLSQTVQYVGIHPMAGKEVSGFDNADPAIFKDCGFIITPIHSTAASGRELMRELGAYMGAKHFAVSEPSAHDETIAYTSDLMHIASFALCAGYPETFSRAYTAGAFRDCTRVALSDPELWTRLLMENGDAVAPWLDRYIGELTAIRQSIRENDRDGLCTLLENAHRNKKEMLEL